MVNVVQVDFLKADVFASGAGDALGGAQALASINMGPQPRVQTARERHDRAQGAYLMAPPSEHEQLEGEKQREDDEQPGWLVEANEPPQPDDEAKRQADRAHKTENRKSEHRL